MPGIGGVPVPAEKGLGTGAIYTGGPYGGTLSPTTLVRPISTGQQELAAEYTVLQTERKHRGDVKAELEKLQAELKRLEEEAKARKAGVEALTKPTGAVTEEERAKQTLQARFYTSLLPSISGTVPTPDLRALEAFVGVRAPRFISQAFKQALGAATEAEKVIAVETARAQREQALIVAAGQQLKNIFTEYDAAVASAKVAQKADQQRLIDQWNTQYAKPQGQSPVATWKEYVGAVTKARTDYAEYQAGLTRGGPVYDTRLTPSVAMPRIGEISPVTGGRITGVTSQGVVQTAKGSYYQDTGRAFVEVTRAPPSPAEPAIKPLDIVSPTIWIGGKPLFVTGVGPAIRVPTPAPAPAPAPAEAPAPAPGVTFEKTPLESFASLFGAIPKLITSVSLPGITGGKTPLEIIAEKFGAGEQAKRISDTVSTVTAVAGPALLVSTPPTALTIIPAPGPVAGEIPVVSDILKWTGAVIRPIVTPFVTAAASVVALPGALFVPPAPTTKVEPSKAEAAIKPPPSLPIIQIQPTFAMAGTPSQVQARPFQPLDIFSYLTGTPIPKPTTVDITTTSVFHPSPTAPQQLPGLTTTGVKPLDQSAFAGSNSPTALSGTYAPKFAPGVVVGVIATASAGLKDHPLVVKDQAGMDAVNDIGKRINYQFGTNTPFSDADMAGIKNQLLSVTTDPTAVNNYMRVIAAQNTIVGKSNDIGNILQSANADKRLLTKDEFRVLMDDADEINKLDPATGARLFDSLSGIETRQYVELQTMNLMNDTSSRQEDWKINFDTAYKNIINSVNAMGDPTLLADTQSRLNEAQAGNAVIRVIQDKFSQPKESSPYIPGSGSSYEKRPESDPEFITFKYLLDASGFSPETKATMVSKYWDADKASYVGHQYNKLITMDTTPGWDAITRFQAVAHGVDTYMAPTTDSAGKTTTYADTMVKNLMDYHNIMMPPSPLQEWVRGVMKEETIPGKVGAIAIPILETTGVFGPIAQFGAARKYDVLGNLSKELISTDAYVRDTLGLPKYTPTGGWLDIPGVAYETLIREHPISTAATVAALAAGGEAISAAVTAFPALAPVADIGGKALLGAQIFGTAKAVAEAPDIDKLGQIGVGLAELGLMIGVGKMGRWGGARAEGPEVRGAWVEEPVTTRQKLGMFIAGEPYTGRFGVERMKLGEFIGGPLPGRAVIIPTGAPGEESVLAAMARGGPLIEEGEPTPGAGEAARISLPTGEVTLPAVMEVVPTVPALRPVGFPEVTGLPEVVLPGIEAPGARVRLPVTPITADLYRPIRYTDTQRSIADQIRGAKQEYDAAFKGVTKLEDKPMPITKVDYDALRSARYAANDKLIQYSMLEDMATKRYGLEPADLENIWSGGMHRITPLKGGVSVVEIPTISEGANPATTYTQEQYDVAKRFLETEGRINKLYERATGATEKPIEVGIRVREKTPAESLEMEEKLVELSRSKQFAKEFKRLNSDYMEILNAANTEGLTQSKLFDAASRIVRSDELPRSMQRSILKSMLVIAADPKAPTTRYYIDERLVDIISRYDELMTDYSAAAAKKDMPKIDSIQSSVKTLLNEANQLGVAETDIKQLAGMKFNIVKGEIIVHVPSGFKFENPLYRISVPGRDLVVRQSAVGETTTDFLTTSMAGVASREEGITRLRDMGRSDLIPDFVSMFEVRGIPEAVDIRVSLESKIADARGGYEKAFDNVKRLSIEAGLSKVPEDPYSLGETYKSGEMSEKDYDTIRSAIYEANDKLTQYKMWEDLATRSIAADSGARPPGKVIELVTQSLLTPIKVDVIPVKAKLIGVGALPRAPREITPSPAEPKVKPYSKSQIAAAKRVIAAQELFEKAVEKIGPLGVGAREIILPEEVKLSNELDRAFRTQGLRGSDIANIRKGIRVPEEVLPEGIARVKVPRGAPVPARAEVELVKAVEAIRQLPTKPAAAGPFRGREEGVVDLMTLLGAPAEAASRVSKFASKIAGSVRAKPPAAEEPVLRMWEEVAPPAEAPPSIAKSIEDIKVEAARFKEMMETGRAGELSEFIRSDFIKGLRGEVAPTLPTAPPVAAKLPGGIDFDAVMTRLGEITSSKEFVAKEVRAGEVARELLEPGGKTPEEIKLELKKLEIKKKMRDIEFEEKLPPSTELFAGIPRTKSVVRIIQKVKLGMDLARTERGLRDIRSVTRAGEAAAGRKPYLSEFVGRFRMPLPGEAPGAGVFEGRITEGIGGGWRPGSRVSRPTILEGEPISLTELAKLRPTILAGKVPITGEPIVAPAEARLTPAREKEVVSSAIARVNTLTDEMNYYLRKLPRDVPSEDGLIYTKETPMGTGSRENYNLRAQELKGELTKLFKDTSIDGVVRALKATSPEPEARNFIRMIIIPKVLSDSVNRVQDAKRRIMENLNDQDRKAGEGYKAQFRTIDSYDVRIEFNKMRDELRGKEQEQMRRILGPLVDTGYINSDALRRLETARMRDIGAASVSQMENVGELSGKLPRDIPAIGRAPVYRMGIGYLPVGVVTEADRAARIAAERKAEEEAAARAAVLREGVGVIPITEEVPAVESRLRDITADLSASIVATGTAADVGTRALSLQDVMLRPALRMLQVEEAVEIVPPGAEGMRVPTPPPPRMPRPEITIKMPPPEIPIEPTPPTPPPALPTFRIPSGPPGVELATFPYLGMRRIVHPIATPQQMIGRGVFDIKYKVAAPTSKIIPTRTSAARIAVNVGGVVGSIVAPTMFGSVRTVRPESAKKSVGIDINVMKIIERYGAVKAQKVITTKKPSKKTIKAQQKAFEVKLHPFNRKKPRR